MVPALMRPFSLRPLLLAVMLGTATQLGGLTPAYAAGSNCYELIGCPHADRFRISDLMTLSCQSLWEVRNTVFKQNGYCFRTADAIRAFGNAGCQYEDERAVPLNAHERENVAAIRQAEQRKGCRAGGR